MGRIFKALIYLAILAALGLVGFAYFGDMAPRRIPVSVPVMLNAGE
ncbi:hypothetical protein SAMN05878426_103251 [Phaeovulum vinaykumarii]|uniref:Uncharacterized protein n=2 Tax=Phaeovulum vinaykumarii TaxID=407234 RepID=A0A1N7LMK9_9RHOB|nr:hypothetical protein SAMN05421795_103251 [Phaeovulum vinaykumarii]SOC05449.1 hypothetical protein SAMN05878426_103251 [Phaeovulum vinaykumarii]